MSNPLYYLFAVMIGLSYPTGSEPLRFARPEDRGLVLPAVAAAAVLMSLVSWALYGRTPISPRRLLVSGLAVKTFGLGLYAVLVGVFHWPLFVWEKMRLEEAPFAGDLMVLSPIFVLLGIHSIFAIPSWARARGLATSRDLTSFAWRTFLAFSLLPILFLLALQATFESWRLLQKTSYVYPFVSWLFAGAVVSVFLVVAPAALRFAFRCRRVPPGPKRDRLEALARSAGFGFTDLLLVETGGARVANAFIVGLVPGLRYVFFTDLLYDHLNEEELECVMAHEMVHALRKHILFYLIFSVTFLALATFLHESLASIGAARATLAGASLLAALLSWGVIFGFVSKRFESEADLAGARLTRGDAALFFVSTLHRVCELNRIPPEVGSWRHWSVTRRTELLLAARAEPGRGLRFERMCSRIRTVFLIVAASAAVYGGLRVNRQVGEAAKRRTDWGAIEEAERGQDLLRHGRPIEAIPVLNDSIRRGADFAHTRLLLAAAYEEMGDMESAREQRDAARRLSPVDARERLMVE